MQTELQNVELALHHSHPSYHAQHLSASQSPLPQPQIDDELTKELFFVFEGKHVVGPFNKQDIMVQYISKRIEGKLYIKSVADAHDNWTKFNLSKRKDFESSNGKLANRYPDLYKYLHSKIVDKKIKPTGIPIDLPKEAESCSFLVYLGKILAVLYIIFIITHVIITFCVAMLCFGCYWGYIQCKDSCIGYEHEEDEEEDDEADEIPLPCCVIIMFSLAYLGMIYTPIGLVYVLLEYEIHDHFQWDEIQSWMIAYISWGICTFCVVLIRLLLQRLNIKSGDQMMFFLIGIEMETNYDVNSALRTDPFYMIQQLFMYPSLAALLPAAIIGFISNFVLEEKFLLRCADDIVGELCDGERCCDIISSHSVENFYEFIGGLASNIIAIWAIIRVIGYLMVIAEPEISLIAKQRH